MITLAACGVIAWFGFPVESRQILASWGLRTGPGKSRVGAFPIGADGTLPPFRRARVSVPEPPDGVELATPAFDIEPRNSADPPFEISFPLLHPSFGDDEDHTIVMGHHIDGEWRPLPTEVIEDRVWAVTDSFSVFAGWSVPTEDVDDADMSSLRVPPPRMMFGRVRGENISIHVDLRGLDLATDPDAPWEPGVRVAQLRVEIAEGAAASYAAYEVNGEPLVWDTEERVGVLPIVLTELPGSLRHDTTVEQRPWRLRVVPVFSDASVGPASEPVEVYPDVLRSYVWLRRNMPWGATQREAFLTATSENPLGIVFGSYLGNAYNGSVGWSRRRLWGRLRAGVRHPHIGMRPRRDVGAGRRAHLGALRDAHALRGRVLHGGHDERTAAVARDVARGCVPRGRRDVPRADRNGSWHPDALGADARSAREPLAPPAGRLGP